MKILLVAVDAKFIHTNLAVNSLRSYSGAYKEHIKIAQFTINNTKEEILRGIYLNKADVVAFSCYIWNISLILSVAESLRKVQPGVKIWLGGPEVSYNPKDYLSKYKEIDGIVIGEGEKTFYELVRYYLGLDRALGKIRGIAYRDSAKTDNGIKGSDSDNITVTAERECLNLDDIPFPYEDIKDYSNKIIYYESSRGCPYSCSYCLSSAIQGVRFRSVDLVKKELKVFLDNKVPQVKFVDRTFNCNKKHAMEIWKYIKENDNGITNFHFEITADILSEEELNLLTSLRPGLVQLEIGVQSTNPETMKAIKRKVDFNKLSKNVEIIRKAHNIHQHLDLIAGLPLEDYKSFEKSFNDVYSLRPDQLQLGFLKVLKGSIIENQCKDYGIVYNSEPPYEVLFTDYISYDELIKLKGICEMVEIYYNSGQFEYTMEYINHFFESLIKLYEALYHYYDRHGLYTISHSRMSRYEILIKFFIDRMGNEQDENIDIFKNIILFDLCLRERLKSRPDFAGSPVDYKKYREICDKLKTDRSKIHMERFAYDVINSAKSGKGIIDKCIIIFDYENRDPITRSAKIEIIPDE